MVLVALAGCVMPGPFGDRASDVVLVTPEISDFGLDCDVDRGVWTLTIEATSWTGGADSWWTLDGVYVEEHGIDTVAYEPDGSGESLRAEIAVVADWRQLADRNTAFTCADGPNVLVQLADLDGLEVDCRASGPDPALWAEVEGVEPCAAVLP